MGPRGAASEREGRGQADPALDRLLGLPLVPRDGARVLRGPRDRGDDERAASSRSRSTARSAPTSTTIYMEAVQGMTGQGGWPLTVFLDPEGVPFYGGTYFPPEPRQGMPSFRQVAGGDRRRACARPARASCCSPRDAHPRGPVGRRAHRAVRRPARPRAARAAQSRAAARAPTAPRRLRRRAQVPARERARVPAGARRDRARRADPRRDGCTAASTTRSAAASRATRSTPSGSSPTSRRCSTTTRCWPASTCTAGR